MPGQYTVVLTAGGQKYTQPLTVVMDPRIKTSTADLQKQYELSNQVYQDALALQPIIDKAAALTRIDRCDLALAVGAASGGLDIDESSVRQIAEQMAHGNPTAARKGV